MSVATKRMFSSSFFFWVALAILGAWLLTPLREALRFGIDLVGGTYITLEVQTEKAVESELSSQMQRIPEVLEANGVALPKTSVVQDKAIVLTFDSIDEANKASSALKSIPVRAEGMFGDRTIATGGMFTDQTISNPLSQMVQKVEGNVLRLSFSDVVEKGIGADAVQRNIEVLRTRMNPLGVGEITIAAQGEKNIIVELPDVTDRQQAKAMIGKSALLELKLVEKASSDRADLLYQYDGELPVDKEILPGRNRDRKGNPTEFYLVDKQAYITGKDLRNAKPKLDERLMQTVVAFELTDDGGKRFNQVTSQNVGKRLAIVLDGVVISAPQIMQAMNTDGQIQGGFTADSAKELALLLKSGAFVAPVTFEEERQIGPALGAESIRKGLMSCLVGLGMLFIFSVLYYKTSGLFAFVALLYNLFLILLGLSWLGATLTLPGIAGMVLTTGMAIDASVLIYERIKEELRSGVPFRKAVEAGFSNAMVVILDSNITNLIVGIVLYRFGTGPIQGFAVTMMLGIFSTLITGLLFLRSLFRFILNTFGVQKVSI